MFVATSTEGWWALSVSSIGTRNSWYVRTFTRGNALPRNAQIRLNGPCTREQGEYSTSVHMRQEHTACGPGLLQSRFASSHQTDERFIKMIGKIAPGMSDIGLTLSSKESKHDIVEDRQYFRRMAHTNLSVVFVQGDIASMMQPILNAPVTRASMRGVVWDQPDTLVN